MATTTNYGWTTPDDTALVKDGAAAIRTLGTSVDTTTKALNPSTTLGDIEYRSSTANTNTRLGIGSTGNVLTVSGGVPAWVAPSGGAGNMVQVATGTLSGTSVTISSLSTYTDLCLYVFGVTTGGSYQLRFRLNNNSGANYNNLSLSAANLTGGFERDMSGVGGSAYEGIDMPSTISQYNNGNNNWFIKFTNCKNAGFTDYDGIAHVRTSSNSDDRYQLTAKGVYSQSEAISSIVITTVGGATFASGTYYIWGA
jgi:hypothetical protein